MSTYTIVQHDDTSRPVHTYRWSLLKDGKPVGEMFTQADAETIRAALNGELLALVRVHKENICAAHGVDWCEVCLMGAAFQHTRQRRK